MFYNAAMSYRKTSHAVYDLKYHLVWVTKYRKPVLRGEIAPRLRELLRQTCATLEVYIISGPVAVDHVHLLVSVPPNVSVSDLMQRLKGRSSRRMLEEFGELNRQFWATICGHAVTSPRVRVMLLMRSSSNTLSLKVKTLPLMKIVASVSTTNSALQATFSRRPSYRLLAGSS